jgi:hypothetical protein
MYNIKVQSNIGYILNVLLDWKDTKENLYKSQNKKIIEKLENFRCNRALKCGIHNERM